MASTRTFQSLYQEIQGFIGDKSPETLVKIKSWINEAIHEIWNRHSWDFKVKRQALNTIAPFEDGTVTLAVGGTAAIGAATGWTSALEGRKFAASLGEVWTLVDTVGSATGLTLEEAHTGSALAASTYNIFQDWYNLSSDVDSIISVKCLDGNWPPLVFTTYEEVMELYPTSHSGRPEAWYLAPNRDDDDGIVLGIWPVPDEIYRLEIKFNRFIVNELTNNSDTSPCPRDFDNLIIKYALEQAAIYDYLDNKGVLSGQRFEDLLLRKIRTHSDVESPHYRLKGFDEGGSDSGILPGRFSDFYADN